nr:nucleotidyltransferase family protein [Pseudoruegeria sp. HB172150]
MLFAAGSSSRMGARDKLTEDVDGEPLLRRSALRAIATGLPVHALLPPDRPERWRAVEGLDLTLTAVPDARDGMSASIRAGLASLPERTPGTIMLMADMPDLESADLTALAKRFADLGSQTVVRAATEDGRPGAPALIPRHLFPALQALQGDTGGRDVLKSVPQDLVPLPGRRAVTDLDTPDDWAEWRETRG